jgi:pyridoxine 4-dehydrogenase
MLGGRPVGRIGFGAMQLAGPGVFGPPRDRDAELAVLRRTVELGVDHIDTSQFYGPDVVNDLIREALHPYPDGLRLATKVGARRDAEGGWLPAQRPEELRAGVEDNLRSLQVERIDLVNLRLLPGDGAPEAPLAEQLGALEDMRAEGKLELIGVSNVSREQAEQALELVAVAGFQNGYSLLDRSSEDRSNCAGSATSPSCRSSRSARRSPVARRASRPTRLCRASPQSTARHRRRSRWRGCSTATSGSC